MFLKILIWIFAKKKKKKVIVLNNPVVFEIVVRNTGDIKLSDVKVSENPHDGLKYISWYDNSALWRYNGDLT